MKKLITIGTFLALAACSNPRSTQEGETVFSDSSSAEGIIGGTPVTAQDDISKTTVQIFTFEVKRDSQGHTIIADVGGCTGSILANDIILTAAHCTTENPYYILLYFGTDSPDMDKLLPTVNTNPAVRRVIGGAVTPLWPKLTPRLMTNWGDMALLKFRGGLPAGYHAANLLPTVAQLQKGQTLTLAGWGLVDGINETDSDTLRKVDVNIINPAYSQTEMMIDSSHGKGPCHGDSGGPAYANQGGKLYVSGITSRADRTTDPGGKCIGNTVYTKVQPYLAWIAQTMKTLQAPDYKPVPIPQPE
jgi:hypothetical protein